MLDETRIGDDPTDTILVNRQYLRRVEQIEQTGSGEGARS
jgi:hypothetical protein